MNFYIFMQLYGVKEIRIMSKEDTNIICNFIKSKNCGFNLSIIQYSFRNNYTTL